MSIVCEKCAKEFGLDELRQAKGRCPGCGAEIPVSDYCFRRPEGLLARFASAPLRVKLACAVNVVTFMLAALLVICSVPRVAYDSFFAVLLPIELSLVFCLCMMEHIETGGCRFAAGALLFFFALLHFVPLPGVNILAVVALEIVGGAVLSAILSHDSVRRWRQMRRDVALAYSIARRHGRGALLPPRRKSQLGLSSVVAYFSMGVMVLLPLLVLCVRMRDFVDILCVYDLSRGNVDVTVAGVIPLSSDRATCLSEGIVIPDVVQGDVWWAMQRMALRIMGLPPRKNAITKIGANAFAGCASMPSVTIPSSVREIGASAFAGCVGLTAVDLPNGVQEIGRFAFSGCSGLKSVTVPGAVREIGNGAFLDCTGLTSVVVANGVRAIGNHAFAKCGRLTAVTLPASVKEIAANAFMGSPVKTVTVDKGDAERIRGLLGGKLGQAVQIVER